MTKLSPEIEKALAQVVETRNRILRLGAPEGADADVATFSDAQASALNSVCHVSEYVNFLLHSIMASGSRVDKAKTILVLDILMLTLENLFRFDLADSGADDQIRAQLQARMERARSAINRKPAGFFTEIVVEVFREHVEANGPWTDRLSKLARKLKPEIDRRAAIGGGTELEVDTITRRLKALIAPSQH